jgi:chromate transport protein ChrA
LRHVWTPVKIGACGGERVADGGNRRLLRHLDPRAYLLASLEDFVDRRPRSLGELLRLCLGLDPQPAAAIADPVRAASGGASYSIAARGDAERTRPGLGALSLVLLWIGATSFGGSTPPYFYEQLVRRRGWIKPDDFAEGYAVGRLLPGPTGANTLAYLIQTIRGPLVAAYCLLPYALPSVLIMLALSIALAAPVHNVYINGALMGAAMGGIGVLVATVIQLMGSARRARLWPLVALLAFILNGLLGLNFVVTLLVLSLVSVLCNWPRLL